MSFKKLLESANTQDNQVITEAVADKLAKMFVDDLFSNKYVEFKYYLENDEKEKTVKVDSVEAIEELAGGTKMLSNGQTLALVFGNASAIKDWKEWLVKEAFRYSFDKEGIGGSRAKRYITQKEGYKNKVSQISYKGIVFDGLNK